MHPLRELFELDSQSGEAYYTLYQAVSRMLTMDPVERVEARDALSLPFFDETEKPSASKL